MMILTALTLEMKVNNNNYYFLNIMKINVKNLMTLNYNIVALYKKI
jgi:hypothetical protein